MLKITFEFLFNLKKFIRFFFFISKLEIANLLIMLINSGTLLKV